MEKGLHYTLRIEDWRTGRGQEPKVAVRDQFGRFHGATNYKARPGLAEALARARGQ